MALIEKLNAIADAIRAQSEKTDKLTLEQMASEIGELNPVNFRVVGNPQPASPGENTIWLNTEVPITGYDFSAAEPANPVEGMAWVSVGTSSPAAFNALKKNSAMVYPLSAKQYVSGAWVDKGAKSYQNGKWVGWVTYLFKEGTGVGSYPFHTSAESGQVTVNSNAVVFSGTNGKAYLTQNAVSFAENKTFCVEATVSYIGPSSEWQGSVVVKSAAHFSTEAGKQNPSTSVARTKFSANNSRTVYRVSVPAGSYHVGVSGDIQGKIHNMWIE